MSSQVRGGGIPFLHRPSLPFAARPSAPPSIPMAITVVLLLRSRSFARAACRGPTRGRAGGGVQDAAGLGHGRGAGGLQRPFDPDGDGLLPSCFLQSPQDVQFFFEALGETLDFETSRAMVAAVDGDQDGLINFDEFLGLMSAAQMA